MSEISQRNMIRGFSRGALAALCIAVPVGVLMLLGIPDRIAITAVLAFVLYMVFKKGE